MYKLHSVTAIDFVGMDDHLNPRVHWHAVHFSQTNAGPKDGSDLGLGCLTAEAIESFCFSLPPVARLTYQ